MRYRVRADQRSAPLTDTEVVIGRSPYCTLILDQGSVSRIHAALKRLGDVVEIADLGSTHGTFINGHRIVEPVLVMPGDEIRIGTERILLEQVERDTPITACMDPVRRKMTG